MMRRSRQDYDRFYNHYRPFVASYAARRVQRSAVDDVVADQFEALEALNPEPENRGNPGSESPHRRRWLLPAAAAAALVLVAALALATRDRSNDGTGVLVVAAQTSEPTDGTQPGATVTPIPLPTGVPLPMLDRSGRDDPDFVAGWLALDLGTEMPESLQFPALAIEVGRHAALLNHAQNVLQRPCIIAAGFEFPDINILGNRGPEPMRSSEDFELDPFAPDGGYGLTANRARVDSTIGPEANALSAAHGQYVNALPPAELARYEEVSATCLEQGSAEIMAGNGSVNDFYALVNVAINLPFAASGLLDEHPQAQAAAAVWQRCMADAGQPFADREAALQQALAERLPSTFEKNLSPGPIELSIAGADRTCSEQLGYVAERSAGLAAAEQYLLEHDAPVIEFVTRWQTMQPGLRTSLEAILGVELVTDIVQG